MKEKTISACASEHVYDVFVISLPIASAYFPLSMALGLYAVSIGVPGYAAPLAASVVYAGSAEFLAVNFISQGLSLVTVAWLTFLVNFRHVFYGLSFPLDRLCSRAQKLYGIFALTDEIYGVLTSKQGKQLSGRAITLLQVLAQFWWASGALVGVSVGAHFAAGVGGFEFALIAMFLVLTIDAIKHTTQQSLIIYAVVSAAFSLWVEHTLLADSFLLTGIITYCVLLLVRYPFVRVSK